MKILITGATGFIGSHLTRTFCRDHQVFALVRPGSDARFIRRYPITRVEGDLHSGEALKTLLAGIDLVIHAAARASDWGDYPDFHQVNVEGSLNLINALPATAKMIHISTNAVLGEEDHSGPKPENAPYSPVLPYVFESFLPSGMNHYRLSKALAEQLVIRRAEIRGIPLTVIRPVWVYGPREFHAGPYEYCQTVQIGIPALPGCSTNRFHVIFVEDLARIVKHIAERQAPGIEIYHVGNPEIPFMADYWRGFCRELKCSRPKELPKFLVYWLGIFLEAIWMLWGAKNPPLLTRARIYLFYAENVYTVNKLLQDFPEVSFTPLARGIRKTVRWWRLNGFLD